MKEFLFILNMCFCFLSLKSQTNIQTRIFSSGFNAQDSTWLIPERLFELNDSTVYFNHRTKQSGHRLQYLVRIFLNSNNLTTRYVDTVYNYQVDVPLLTDSPSTFSYLPVVFNTVDEKNNNFYNFKAVASQIDKSLHIEVYSINQLGLRNGIVSSFSLKNRVLLHYPLIYDSTIYLRCLNLANDTVFLEAVNVNGSYVGNGSFADNAIFPNFASSKGPLAISPLNDSLLLMGNETLLNLIFINRFNFQVQKVNSLTQAQTISLTNQNQWSGHNNNRYTFFPLYYEISGELFQTPFLKDFNFQLDRGGFSIRLDYNGTILSTSEYGNDTINEIITNNFLKGNAHYYIGSSSFDLVSRYAQDFRGLFLCKQTTLSRDSIILYGNKNHIGYSVVVNNNDDVFALSQYSNAWTDDSIFTVVTKIPNSFLIGIKENNPQITSVRVFPNPTMDLLKVDGAENGDSYRVVSISGQLMQEGILTNEKSINVAALKQGSYILQLGSQQQTYRANVFIKQ